MSARKKQCTSELRSKDNCRLGVLVRNLTCVSVRNKQCMTGLSSKNDYRLGVLVRNLRCMSAKKRQCIFVEVQEPAQPRGVGQESEMHVC